VGQPGNTLVNKVDFTTLWTYSFKNINETFIINIIKILLKVFIKTSFKYFFLLIQNKFNFFKFKNYYFRYYRRSKVSNRILNMKVIYWDRRILFGTTDSKIWLHDFKNYFVVNWVIYKNVFSLLASLINKKKKKLKFQ